MQLNSSMFQLSCFKREKNIYKGKGKLQECQTEDLKAVASVACQSVVCKDLKGCRMPEPLAGRGGDGWL